MASLGGPHIVTDGLVLSLDAGNIKSYTSGSTTWFDKSGFGNNGTLENGPTFNSGSGGSIVFDGVNDLISVQDATTLDIVKDKTLSCWVYMGATSTGCGITGKSSSATYGMALGYGWGGNGFMALAWNSDNAPYIAKDAGRDVGKWNYLSAVQAGSTRYIYVWDAQGLRTSNYSGGTHTWNNNVPLMVGNANNGSSPAPSNTRISGVAAYNRALTPDEILQNYNATRTRFGL
jgi:hypothetical protein